MDKPLVITQHARNAMMLRRVDIHEVIDIIHSPEVTDRDTEGNKRYFKGRLCVVTRDEKFRLRVKTVLYRYGEKWTDEDVRNRPRS